MEFSQPERSLLHRPDDAVRPHRVSRSPGDSARLQSRDAAAQPSAPLADMTHLSGGGHELPDRLRSGFESALGANLSHVRVHHDAESARHAARLAARAFTWGGDVFFGQGEFNPETTDGKALLAHEMVHASRSTGTRHALPGGLSRGEVSSPSGREEIQAHDFAESFSHGNARAVTLSPRVPGEPMKVFREPTATAPQTEAGDDAANDTLEEISAAEEAGFDDTAQAGPSVLDSVLEGAAGVAYGSVQSMTPGGFAAPSPRPNSRLFEFFRGAGQLATGVATMAAGAGGEIGGVALDATGVGAVVGVPLNVVAGAAIAQGAVSSAAGVQTLLHAMSTGGGKPASRLPPQGSAARKVIEQDRRTGIRLAKARELKNIKAGGKGTQGNEVWTEKELEVIRKDAKFPVDTRWHHSPTVANRPDLAADPNVVRPVRGGTQGHLAAHGGDFRK